MNSTVFRVQRLGFASRQGGVPREENPYHELVEALSTDEARELAAAWWRGWDRATPKEATLSHARTRLPAR
jgi:hypothetical protein